MSIRVRARIHNAAFLAFAFAFLVFAMFPGRFEGDAISGYRQGLNFWFTDATSVQTSVLMGMLADIAPGPRPMFVLQLALWIGGLWLFTDALIASGLRTAGQAISALAVTPFLAFGFFDVAKDVFLSALLIVLIGAAARRLLLGTPGTLLSVVVTAAIFLLALDTRHNAMFALVPIALLFWPQRTWRLRPLATAALAVLALLAGARLLLNTVNHGPFRADRAQFAYSLVVYDLAGISVRAHEDASEGRVADFLAQSQRCYSVHEWDGFQSGPCQPTGLAAQQRMMDPRARRDLFEVWAGEVLRHPIAYAAHRAHHFGCHLGLGCRREHQVMSAGWWPRAWDEPNMRVSAAARALGALAVWMWQGPLGSGLLWLGVAGLEVLVGGLSLRRDGFNPPAYLTLLIGAAAFLYLAAFAVVGIADQMRYLHPTMFLAAVALPLAVATLAQAWRGGRGAAAGGLSVVGEDAAPRKASSAA